MKADLIIYNAGQLVTCTSDGKAKKGAAAMGDVGIIKNGAAAVLNGEIAGIGDSEEILRNFTADVMIDAEKNAVCPGFVECHTHIVYAGNRLDEFELKIKGADHLEILKSGGGILSTVKQTRQATLEELVEQSRPRLDKMLRLGVTVCEVKTGYGLSTTSELKILRAILELDKTHPADLIPTFLAAHAVPPEFKENPDDYVDLICGEMLPQAAALLEKNGNYSSSSKPDNPFFADVFCEKNAFDLEQSRRVLTTAKSLGFGLKAHVDEFTNLGGARMAIELGAASIDHLDAISDDEIKTLAASETVGVVTPTVNFNFGSKEFADARKLI
ncbi:MAG: imidazolonepropionase, partial [Pyrinomonadaceae bacterium]